MSVPEPVTLHLLELFSPKSTVEVVPAGTSIGKLKVTVEARSPMAVNLPPFITSLEAVPIPASEIDLLESFSSPPCNTTLPSYLKNLALF